MDFPAETTSMYLLDGLFHQELGHAAFCKVAKITAYPLSAERLKSKVSDGHTHVHIIIETTIRASVEAYPSTNRSMEIIPIEEALNRLNKENA